MKWTAFLYQLGGGAPRSVLAYLTIIKGQGGRVTVAAQKDEDGVLALYRETVDGLVLGKTFKHLWDEHRFLAAYGALRDMRRLIRREGPDCVLAVGEVNGFFLSHLCRRLALPLIILIAGGDLSKNGYLAEKWEWGQVICFSEENREVILAHHPDMPVQVIANRIQASPAFFDAETHYRDVREVNVLITSRLVPGKIESVLRFLEELEESGYGPRLHVKIAGKGEALPFLRRQIQERFEQRMDVELLGHVDDLRPLFAWAHLAAGKGRSVVEPILLGRIGCVLTEEGPACVCSLGSLETLAHYNFSGRGMGSPSERDRVAAVIGELLKGTADLPALARCAEGVRRRYSAEYLPEQWERALSACLEAPRGKRRTWTPVLPRYLQFIVMKAKHKRGR